MEEREGSGMKQRNGQPQNGIQLLKMLRKSNGKQVQSFKDLAGYIGFKARDKGIPVNGQFELTPLCNFSCKMCYVHLDMDQLSGSPVLSAEAWKDLIHQAWEAGMLEATLTGGECLAYPWFDDIYLYLHSLGCQVAVLTNGYLLDDQRIAFFSEHKPVRIQVTLYGWNDDVYERVTGQRAFAVVAENIRKAVAADLPLAVNVTPSVYLGEDALETLRIGKQLCRSIMVNSYIFSPREETGRASQQDNPDRDLYLRMQLLRNQLDGIEPLTFDEDQLPPSGSEIHVCSKCGLRCGGGRSGFVVDWRGTLMPCNRMEMIRAFPLRDGFREAWNQINKEANNWPRVPVCEGCAYNGVCDNCAANMLRFADPGKLPVQLCEETKFFVRHGIRRLPDCE